MNCYLDKKQKICVLLTIFTSMWYIVVADEPDEEKSLKLKYGVDSLLETNATPLLQIRNFKGSEISKKLNEKRLSRRSIRSESSSKSEENVGDKDKDEKNNVGQARQSDLSDDAESSDSDGDRRISTKGLIPDDFEPESNPNIHERYSKDSGSE